MIQIACSSVRSSLAGRESVLQAMPEEVVSAAYRMDRNEVREVMRNREDETLILPPSPRHQRDIKSRVQVE